MQTGRDPPVLSTHQHTDFIGVFDSGVGGLSVLRALRCAAPKLPLAYLADSAHAPYGERDAAFVVERSLRIAERLIDEGARGLVVACNTATAVAVQALRERWPARAIVGVEPGLKPAVAASRSGRIGVLATRGTLASEKFHRLLAAQPDGVCIVPQASPGLARLIEQGDLRSPALLAAVEEHCAALRDQAVDTVVLGCTHYAFVEPAIRSAMGDGVHIIDTAEAVARHALRRIEVPASALGERPARVLTTGAVDALRTIASAWLDFDCSVEAAIDC
jgi:glutamate racemase